MNSPDRSAIVIVDAGIGNLGNVKRAVEHVLLASSPQLGGSGLEVVVTDDPDQVRDARVLILPGVGAFRPPRERLRGRLEEAIASSVSSGTFLLGICVGYQLLFESGDEFGETDGLGYFSGKVSQLPDCSAQGASLPHIGWNRLVDCSEHPLLDGAHDQCVYFVHSYAPTEVPAELQLASCQHGIRFPAVVARGNVMGTQFHPEKSGDVGLRILANFFALTGVTHA